MTNKPPFHKSATPALVTAVALFSVLLLGSCALFQQTEEVTTTGVWLSEKIPAATMRFMFTEAFGDYTTVSGSKTTVYSAADLTVTAATTATGATTGVTADGTTICNTLTGTSSYGATGLHNTNTGNAYKFRNYFNHIADTESMYIRLTINESANTSKIEILGPDKTSVLPDIYNGTPTYLQTPYFSWSGTDFERTNSVIISDTLNQYLNGAGTWGTYPSLLSSTNQDYNFNLALSGVVTVSSDKSYLGIDCYLSFPFNTGTKSLHLAYPTSLVTGTTSYRVINFWPS